MSNNDTFNEDAKSEWLRLVRKHRRKQAGLPALSKLNTNAGNVELGMNLFNTLNNSESISVDAVNGNVSSADCCVGESIELTKEHKMIKEMLKEDMNEYVEIDYDDIYVVVSPSYGNRSHEWDEEIKIDWSYTVDKQDVITFLYEECVDEKDYPKIYDVSTEDAIAWIDYNFDELFDKYAKDIKEYFREGAEEDANYNYDPSDYVDWDMMPGGYDYDDPLSESVSDDDFDMSMRTLL